MVDRHTSADPAAPTPAMPPLPTWLLVALGALLLGIFAYRIGANPMKWEEPRRTLVALEMIYTGDYIVPRILGQPYLKKPPLQNWLIAMLSAYDARYLGPWTGRLLSLLALGGSCLLLWRLGRDGSGTAPDALPAVIFATMGTVLQQGRTGEIDTLFCTLVFAALAFFELGRRRNSAWLQWIVPQIFVAAGVLTKLIAPLFFYPPVLYLIWRRRAQFRFRPLAFAVGLVLLVALVGAWTVPYSAVNPASGMRGRWLTEILVRTVGQGLGGSLRHLATYPLLLLGATAPWSLYLLTMPGEAWREARDSIRRDPYLGLSAAVVVWGVLVFLFVPEQKSRYLMPIFPFLSVLLANFIGRGLSWFSRRRSWIQKLFGHWVAWAFLAAAWAVVALNSDQLPSRSLAWPPLVAGVAVITLAGFWIAVRKQRLPAAPLAVLALLYGVAQAGVVDVREAMRNLPYVDASSQIASAIQDGRPVVGHRALSLKLYEPVSRRIGRPLARRVDTPEPAYWIAKRGLAGHGVGEPILETPPTGRIIPQQGYALWEIEAPEAWSLLAAPLYTAPLNEQLRLGYEAKLDQARVVFEREPEAIDAIIWLGRRTAYLGRYREAIAIYSRGLRLHPREPRLYRHRGHRYISVRKLDAAIADFEHAASLTTGRPDQVEPDGLPNARNIPTSTLNSNIWYHLALAYYVKGDLANAERAYLRCLEFSKNPDMLSATTHWLYMTLRRAGQGERARQVLQPIRADMGIIENRAYHRLLLMYRGELTPDEVLERSAAESGTASAATLYGVANWHLYNGRRDEAMELFQRILALDSWAAFGFIAAEADVARIMDRAL